MPNNTLDLAKLYSDEAKEILAQTLISSASLDLSQATPYQLIKVLLKDKDVNSLLLSLGLEEKLFQNLEKGESMVKTMKIERVSFSLELKKIIFFAYQESLLFNRPSVTNLDLFLACSAFLPSFDVEKARKSAVGILGGKEDTQITPTLDQFCLDLTKKAKFGQLDEVVGREAEIEQAIRILARRTKSNVVLLGEAGVGKTAIVEGLAQKIIAKQVPPILKDVRVLSLNLTQIMAGTEYQGELEKRFTSLLEEVKKGGSVILFIDELHMLIGAGGMAGSMSAANILKPALARGEIHTIGATTPTEYRQYIERDPALSRRFEPIFVAEPDTETATKILSAVAKKLSTHYQVNIDPEAIQSAVLLSQRYLTDRYLPDKAIDLLDEASSEAKINNKPEVQKDDIQRIISQRTGIPLTNLTTEESQKLLNLEAGIKEYIIGQDQAVTAVSDVIKRARAGLKDPKRPLGSFLLLGPTGVGKTELAKVLAKVVYGNENAMVRLDMSEFTESHTADRLVGAPPGYVGYEEGGQLTNPIRLRPYSLILLDEIEKGHPKVFDVFLQILEDGRLTDAQGHTVDFKNTIVMMTSNIQVTEYVDQSEKDEKKRRDQIMAALTGTFRPEFLNRIDEIILMNPLTKGAIFKIAQIQLKQIQQRLLEQNIHFAITDSALAKLAESAYSPEYGARPLRRLLQQKVEDRLAQELLQGKIKSGENIIWDEKELGI
ncbi:ATP-dependent Clp protease ATP-binding subunit [Candidatus Gottesmanbacteria bacterium]|nr:ATP-dependent Clp protease ATP-binding subunit [Candidatus Gottesmanbacteria bacterium]